MAERLIKYGELFCLGVALLPSGALAEELIDPTRPPAAVAAPVAAPAADNQPDGLQSIIISKTRRAAIIDGKTVELGGKHGASRLIEVNEGSVVLQGVKGRQVLTLFPDVKLSRKEEDTKPQPAARKTQPGSPENKPAARKEEK
jgi:MSHA biogenesis protein MshK